MYQPPHFREDDLAAQHDLIRRNPLGVLVSVGPDGPVANAIPFLLDAARGPDGTLFAHLARANEQWRLLGEAPAALVVFRGVDGYITPSWYATKRETGKVVPTWNYAVVQAHGRARVHHDPAWLHEHVSALTDAHEAARAEPWATHDAPETYLAAQLRGIVGIEIPIDRLEGKVKASQNRSEADREGVAAGLEGERGDDAARAMAALVRGRRTGDDDGG